MDIMGIFLYIIGFGRAARGTFDEFEKALQSKGIRDYRIICNDARGEYGFRRAPGCII